MVIEEKLMKSLYRVYGSSTKYLVEKLYTPPSRLYIRVNTLEINRDVLLSMFKEKGYDVYSDPYVEEAIYFPIKGPYKIPILDKKIKVDKYAAESILMGANLYAPGIHRYDDFREGEEVNVVSPNNMVIAVVETTVSSEKLKHVRRGIIGINKLSLYRAPPIRDLPGYNDGLFYPQSLPAMFVSKILNPYPGELIVDMNSAPGGKTSHLVLLTRGSARIFAFERNLRKSLKVVETLNRLKAYKNVIVAPMDSRYIDQDLLLLDRVDKVLVDPPCTGLGVRPKISIDKTWKDVVVSHNYQFQFIKTAYKILRKGGLMIYSTCTLTFEENELVSLKSIRELGFESIDLGRLPYSDKIYFEDLVAYRFSPLNHDMPGYYIVLFRKPFS